MKSVKKLNTFTCSNKQFTILSTVNLLISWQSIMFHFTKIYRGRTKKPVLNNWRHFCTFQYISDSFRISPIHISRPTQIQIKKPFYEHSAMRNLSINIMFIYSTSHFICVNSHYFCFFSFFSIPFVELDVIIFVIPQVSIRI